MKIIVRELLTDHSTEIDPHARIEFGSGVNCITVAVINGVVQISGKGAMAVLPRASNMIYIHTNVR